MAGVILMTDKKTKKKDYGLIVLFLLVVTLFPFISAVTFESGTTITNNCLGYNFTLLSDLTVDSIVVNSTCEGDINNLTAFYNTTDLHIQNINATGSGTIQLYDIPSGYILKDLTNDNILFSSLGVASDEYNATFDAGVILKILDESPTIIIVNPLSTKDETAQPTNFYITTNEYANCTYSLDGSSNLTMSGSNLTHTATQYTGDGTRTIIYYCTDNSGNIGSTSNTFTVSQVIGGGDTSGTTTMENITTIISEIPEKIIETGESILDIINRRVEDVGDTINKVAPDTISEINLSGWDWIIIMVGILSIAGILIFTLTKWK